MEEYFAPFVGKTGKYSQNHKVVLLDGYSGPGWYDDGSFGSPALAVATAETLAHVRDTECIFVEQNSSSYSALVKSFGDNPRCWIPPRGRIEEHIDAAVKRAGSAPLFAFLDPFGLWLPFRDLTEKLLGRSSGAYGPITEVLLRFDHITVGRCAGNAYGKATTKRRLKAQATLSLRITETLGGEWWKAIWEFDDPKVRLETIRQEYVRQLNGLGWKAISVPVSRRPDGAALYYLVFLTRSWHGVWSFSRACSLAIRAHHEFCMAGQERLWDTSDDWIATIKSNLREMLQKGPVALESSIAEAYGETFCIARDLHLREAIRQLHEEKETATDKKGDLQKKVLLPWTEDRSGSSAKPPLTPKASRPKSARQGFAPRPLASDPPTA